MEHDAWLEQAEFFALGALAGEELRAFEAHLAAGCAQCRKTIQETTRALDQLPAALAPIAPAPSQKSRLFERIDSENPGLTFVHANEGDWPEMLPGIFVKVLHRDDKTGVVTALCRMAPGSRYANHRHTQTEEVLVLEGSCYCGGRLLRKGDYHRAEPSSYHYDTRTDEGSLMLLKTALQNEMLE